LRMNFNSVVSDADLAAEDAEEPEAVDALEVEEVEVVVFEE